MSTGSKDCPHVYVEATVTKVPEGSEEELGLILTICARCGHIAGAER